LAATNKKASTRNRTPVFSLLSQSFNISGVTLCVILPKNQEIMMFRECYALEKIHGTSAHLTHKEELKFSSGAASHVNFVKLFDQEKILAELRGINVKIYGEAYGGKLLGMSGTYGKSLGFIAFDVQIDDMWLAVLQAEDFCKEVGLKFVDYVQIPTEIAFIDAQRDANSTLAYDLGMGDKVREGVVLRPLIEVTKNNGSRIMSKHKRAEFMETKTPRSVDPKQLKVLEDAQAIADEWVTPMRIIHVMQLEKLRLLESKITSRINSTIGKFHTLRK